jgi:hypothetical protein
MDGLMLRVQGSTEAVLAMDGFILRLQDALEQ